ncbi:HNH endonuclease [Bacillus thuringiensis]|uniref:HNH endonuclease n=1 Tax=Bacillus thuringiensis TaxID=1428 RepID=UPI001C54D94F|nr:HNH endonuclease [Bacillus thuringiensis]
MKMSREELISLFHQLEQKLGTQPTKKQWNEDSTTPSEMPIRTNFGNWTNFVKACGKEPLKSEFTIQARLNSIKARKGKTGGNNKGGRHIDRLGYVQIWKPDHPNCKSAGYIHEHRYIMSEHLGRALYKHENVHHINGDRSDNRIENLELWTTTQPSGQRVEDKIEWAKAFLEQYGYEVEKK